MRIAVLATNRNPLAVPYAGGQESLTAALVDGFRRRGHEVCLFAAPGTPEDAADEVVHYPRLPRLSAVAALDPQVPEKPFLDDHHAFTFAVSRLAHRDGSIDIVANHSLHHLPMSLSGLLRAPVVTTLHTPPFPWMELGAALAEPTARYVAVSRALADRWKSLPAVEVVPNGVDPDLFAPGPGCADGRLVWVGRLTPEKAPHLAIAAARLVGRPLSLIGPVGDADYVRDVIDPLMGDGIEHLGPLAAEQIAHEVGRAAVALVTPVWDEPFGLVAVEAAMCGTPVVALRRGGLAEAVTPRTGVLVDTLANDRGARGVRDDLTRGDDAEIAGALAAAMPVAEGLDRSDVRASAVASFGLEACVDGHLAVLERASRKANG